MLNKGYLVQVVVEVVPLPPQMQLHYWPWSGWWCGPYGVPGCWRSFGRVACLLLTLFLLSLTLLFIFTDVPAEAKVRNKGSPPHWTQSKHLFRRSEWAEHRVTNADTVSICEFLTCYDVLVFHNRSSHRSQNHFCTVLCVHRKVKNPVFFHN